MKTETAALRIQNVGPSTTGDRIPQNRHASLLAKAGVPIEVVSKRLGHSNIGITVDRYVTVYRERDVAAAQAFEQLMS